MYKLPSYVFRKKELTVKNLERGRERLRIKVRFM